MKNPLKTWLDNHEETYRGGINIAAVAAGSISLVLLLFSVVIFLLTDTGLFTTFVEAIVILLFIPFGVLLAIETRKGFWEAQVVYFLLVPLSVDLLLNGNPSQAFGILGFGVLIVSWLNITLGGYSRAAGILVTVSLNTLVAASASMGAKEYQVSWWAVALSAFVLALIVIINLFIDDAPQESVAYMFQRRLADTKAGKFLLPGWEEEGSKSSPEDAPENKAEPSDEDKKPLGDKLKSAASNILSRFKRKPSKEEEQEEPAQPAPEPETTDPQDTEPVRAPMDITAPDMNHFQRINLPAGSTTDTATRQEPSKSTTLATEEQESKTKTQKVAEMKAWLKKIKLVGNRGPEYKQAAAYALERLLPHWDNIANELVKRGFSQDLLDKAKQGDEEALMRMAWKRSIYTDEVVDLLAVKSVEEPSEENNPESKALMMVLSLCSENADTKETTRQVFLLVDNQPDSLDNLTNSSSKNEKELAGILKGKDPLKLIDYASNSKKTVVLIRFLTSLLTRNQGKT